MCEPRSRAFPFLSTSVWTISILGLAACGRPPGTSVSTVPAATTARPASPSPSLPPPAPPTGTAPPLPASTSAPEPPPGQLLFSDSFDRQKGGWDLDHAEVADGQMVFTMGGHGLWFSYIPPRREDVHLAFDVALGSGDKDTAMGAMCRNDDAGSAYLFVIYPDGYYGIARFSDGARTWLVEPAFSDAVHMGDAANHIDAICAGRWLQLTVNGSLMATVSDPQPLAGKISALTAGRDAAGPGVVSFDNLVVSVPDEASVAAAGGTTSSAGGLVALPTALGGKANTIFPVPGAGVRNFVDYGDGAIDFETSLDMTATIAYYRDVLAQNGLAEITGRASIKQASFELVYDDLAGGFWVIDGTRLDDGWTHVKVVDQT